MDTHILAKLNLAGILLSSVPLGILYGNYMPPALFDKKLKTYLILLFAILGLFTIVSYFETKFLTDQPPTAMQLWLTPCVLANLHLTAIWVAKRKQRKTEAAS